MKRLFVIVVVVGLISSSAQPAPPPEAPWVLLGLGIQMGAVTMRDTAADADTVSVYGEGLPVYESAAACKSALRHAMQKYAGRSRAEGNFGRFACVDLRTWATSGQ